MTIDYDSLLFMFRKLDSLYIHTYDDPEHFYMEVKFPGEEQTKSGKICFKFDSWGKLISATRID